MKLTQFDNVPAPHPWTSGVVGSRHGDGFRRAAGLADMGSEVIKVEPIDGIAPAFCWEQAPAFTMSTAQEKHAIDRALPPAETAREWRLAPMSSWKISADRSQYRPRYASLSKQSTLDLRRPQGIFAGSTSTHRA